MQPKLGAVSSGEELLSMRNKVDAVHLSPPLQAYMLALVRATREAAAAAGNGGKVLSVRRQSSRLSGLGTSGQGVGLVAWNGSRNT